MPNRFTHLDDDFSTYTDYELENLVGDTRALTYLDRGECLDLIGELALRWKAFRYAAEAQQEGGDEEL